MTLEELIRDASARADHQLRHQGGVPITFIGYRPDHNVGFMLDNETLENREQWLAMRRQDITASTALRSATQAEGGGG